MRKSKFIFFLCELPLVLGVGGKLKKKTARDIYKRTLDIEFEQDQSIGLGSMIGDGQTGRHTHTHTGCLSYKSFFFSSKKKQD